MSNATKTSETKHTISVLMPSYNEETVIEENIISVISVFEKLDVRGEILVCDDGSLDKTKEIISRIAGEKSLVKAFSYSPNRGYGYALRYLLSNASGDFAIAMDADLSMNPEETIKEFKKYFDDYDVIVGSRYKGIKADYPLRRRIPSKIYILLNKILFNLTLQDTQSGFFALRKKVYKNLQLVSDGFSITLECFIKAQSLGYKIIEVPIKYVFDNKSGEISIIKSSINMFYETMKIKKNLSQFLMDRKKRTEK